MLGSLEYSLYNDDVRRKRLVRFGGYYENFNNKDWFKIILKSLFIINVLGEY